MQICSVAIHANSTISGSGNSFFRKKIDFFYKQIITSFRHVAGLGVLIHWTTNGEQHYPLFSDEVVVINGKVVKNVLSVN